jgi:predicted metal-dependent hydrolase
MPAYVVDYVLLHELTHLIVSGHGEDFWERVYRFDLAERARGFLEGVSSVRGRAGPT